jgi:excisionase family DNA binding protein
MTKPPSDLDAEIAKAKAVIKDLVRALARRDARRLHEEEMREAAAAPAVQSSKTTRQPRRLYSMQEAAELLAVSTRTLRREIARGNIPYVRVGTRGMRIDAGDLERYIDQRRRRVEVPQLARPGAARRGSPVYGFAEAHAKRKAEREANRKKSRRGK